MKIGSLQLANPVLLAPMAVITDLPYRLIMKRFGAALVFTEMISANGLFFNGQGTSLSEKPDWADLDSLLIQLATTAPERTLWGQDWPHSWFFAGARGPSPEYAATLAPLNRCLPADMRLQVLQNNPWRLYLQAFRAWISRPGA